jgi:hypothetical protein
MDEVPERLPLPPFARCRTEEDRIRGERGEVAVLVGSGSGSVEGVEHRVDGFSTHGVAAER